jgi:RNA polymerase sigma-70 factor (ECF subfamily)
MKSKGVAIPVVAHGARWRWGTCAAARRVTLGRQENRQRTSTDRAMTELDPRTIAEAQRGHRPAQEAFLRRYVGPMHALVRRSGAPGDPDEVTQDLLHKLLLSLPRFDPAGPARLTTWVFTVAGRWLIDAARRRRRDGTSLEEARHAPQLVDPRPGADVALEQHQERLALERAIARLPPEQRRAFVLAAVHERPLDEVAAAERVPIGTVKSRLHRARAALVRMLAPPGEAGADGALVAAKRGTE